MNPDPESGRRECDEPPAAAVAGMKWPALSAFLSGVCAWGFVLLIALISMGASDWLFAFVVGGGTVLVTSVCAAVGASMAIKLSPHIWHRSRVALCVICAIAGLAVGPAAVIATTLVGGFNGIVVLLVSAVSVGTVVTYAGIAIARRLGLLRLAPRPGHRLKCAYPLGVDQKRCPECGYSVSPL